MFIVGKIDGTEHYINSNIVLDVFVSGNSIFITVGTEEVITTKFAEYDSNEIAKKAMTDFRSALVMGLNVFSFVAQDTSDIFDETAEYVVPF